MSASFKQINFIKNLFTQAQDLTEQSGSHDLAESALAPIQDIIVSALSNPDNVSGPQARQAIDTLLAFNRKVTGLAAAKTLPGLATAERIIPNKFSKDCATCGQTVDAQAGHAALIMGRWDTYCVPCAKGETPDYGRCTAEDADGRCDLGATNNGGLCEAHARPAAPTYTPERGEVHVLDGEYLRVSISQRSGRPYLNRWVNGSYDYAPNVSAKRLSEATKATAEQAAAFGHANEACVFCARDLDTPESITVGYGPTCAAKHALPWGVKVSA